MPEAFEDRDPDMIYAYVQGVLELELDRVDKRKAASFLEQLIDVLKGRRRVAELCDKGVRIVVKKTGSGYRVEVYP